MIRLKPFDTKMKTLCIMYKFICLLNAVVGLLYLHRVLQVPCLILSPEWFLWFYSVSSVHAETVLQNRLRPLPIYPYTFFTQSPFCSTKHNLFSWKGVVTE